MPKTVLRRLKLFVTSDSLEVVEFIPNRYCPRLLVWGRLLFSRLTWFISTKNMFSSMSILTLIIASAPTSLISSSQEINILLVIVIIASNLIEKKLEIIGVIKVFFMLKHRLHRTLHMQQKILLDIYILV